MGTIFKVVGTSELKSRNLFVVYGEIVEGMVHPGMRVSVPKDSPATLAAIRAIDFIDFRMSKQSYVALSFDRSEADRLRGAIDEGTFLACTEA